MCLTGRASNAIAAAFLAALDAYGLEWNMRRRSASIGALALAWLLLPSAASAQHSFPSDEEARTLALTTSPLDNAPAPADGSWETSFMLGLPAGFRIQKAVGPDERSPWLLEGFAGLYAIIPTIGVGVRFRGDVFSGAQDTLVLSPGVDAYVLLDPFAFEHKLFGRGPVVAGVVGPDLDCCWRHRYGDEISGELGLKLGGGYVIGGNTVAPLVALYAGFRY
jgi:hypothetical protein